MDSGARNTMFHHVRLYMDDKNLRNTPVEISEDTSPWRPIQREFYDFLVLVVIRASIN